MSQSSLAELLRLESPPVADRICRHATGRRAARCRL